MLIGLHTLQLRSWRRRCGPQPSSQHDARTQIRKLEIAQLQLRMSTVVT